MDYLLLLLIGFAIGIPLLWWARSSPRCLTSAVAKATFLGRGRKMSGLGPFLNTWSGRKAYAVWVLF